MPTALGMGVSPVAGDGCEACSLQARSWPSQLATQRSQILSRARLKFVRRSRRSGRTGRRCARRRRSPGRRPVPRPRRRRRARAAARRDVDHHAARRAVEVVVMVAAELLVELEEVEVTAARQAPEHAGVGEHGEVAVHRALRQAVTGPGQHLRASSPAGRHRRWPRRSSAAATCSAARRRSSRGADRGVAIAGPGRRRRHAGAPYRWPDDPGRAPFCPSGSAGSGRSRRTEAGQRRGARGRTSPAAAPRS